MNSANDTVMDADFIVKSELDLENFDLNRQDEDEDEDTDLGLNSSKFSNKNRSVTATDFDKDSLESTVKKLMDRVRTLEQRIGPCLESLPLVYQFFNKCNAFEDQRLKAMKKFMHEFGRLADNKDGPVSESRQNHTRQRHKDKRHPQPAKTAVINDDEDEESMNIPEDGSGCGDDSEPEYEDLDTDCDPPQVDVIQNYRNKDQRRKEADPEYQPHQSGSERPSLTSDSFRCKICPSTKSGYQDAESLAKHYSGFHRSRAIDKGPLAPELVAALAAANLEPIAKKPIETRTCHECGKIFAGVSQRNHHMKIKHSSTPHPPVSCDICGKSFRSKWIAQGHQLAKHGSVSETLAAQFTRVKSGPAQKMLPCPDGCGRTFLKAYLAREHLLSCRGLKPHQCDVCGRRFTYKTGLNEHRRETHGEKSFRRVKVACTACGAMVQKKGLQKHMQTCTGSSKSRREPNFFCETCGKGFFFVSALHQHQLKHAKESPTSEMPNSNPPSTSSTKKGSPRPKESS